MAENDWLTPAAAPGPSPYENLVPAAGSTPMAYELRPLTLGELLDRTFAIYRWRFWLFAGIASISGGTSLLVNMVQLVLQHFFWRHHTSPSTQIWKGGETVIVFGLYFLVYSITQAATVFALSEEYLGRTATVGASLRRAVMHWFRYAVIALWQYWTLVWLPLALLVPAFILVAMKVPALAIVGGLLMLVGMFGGLAVGIVLFLRNALAIPAAVIEDLGIRASMRRSKTLSSGAKWRLFVICLVSFALYMVFGVIDIPLGMVAAKAISKGGEAIGTQAVILLIGFLGHTIVSPVALIGWSLVYFDQRVRKEAFDIAFLLGEQTPQEVGYTVPGETALPAAWSEPSVVHSPPAQPYEAVGQETEVRATDDPIA